MLSSEKSVRFAPCFGGLFSLPEKRLPRVLVVTWADAFRG